MITYSIANDYTDTPGPRYESEGLYSGENFRNQVLLKLIKEAKQNKTKILIDLDGGYGYPTSFLEESFGGVRVLEFEHAFNLSTTSFVSSSLIFSMLSSTPKFR